jgi:membrane-associated phospholipid phosphatase
MVARCHWRSVRTTCALLALPVLTIGIPCSANAQRLATPEHLTPPALWWIGGAFVVGALASDAELERASLANRSGRLNDAAHVGNVLGSGRYLLPALGASYLTGRLSRQPRLASTTLHAAVAYTLGNVLVSAGKPVVGRHRPDTTGSAWRFHPFAGDGDHHSWPSAHALHAFTLASAIAEDTRSGWIAGAAYGAAALVGWSRVYEDEHWASDVASSAVLGAAIGHATVRVMRRRTATRSPTHQRHAATLFIVPVSRGVAFRLAW